MDIHKIIMWLKQPVRMVPGTPYQGDYLVPVTAMIITMKWHMKSINNHKSLDLFTHFQDAAT